MVRGTPQILPGTWRGTIRRMVEGWFHGRVACGEPPPPPPRGVPAPRAGKDRKALLLAFLLTAACSGPPPEDTGPLVVSAIGGSLAEGDPMRGPIDAARATYLAATAEGLVSFDAAGGIVPALAERWIVSDDGLSYIFRLRRSGTAGPPIDAETAAKYLRRAIEKNGRNPLKPVLGAIDEIVAMPNDVVEIRLVGPRPNLLQILAQPELAIVKDGAGAGPFAAKPLWDTAARLTLVAQPGNEGPWPRAILLHGDTAGRAVARYTQGGADLVIGGRFTDLPVLQQVKLAPDVLHFDPVEGLFGLAIVSDAGFLASPANRAALVNAIDRDRLVAALPAPGWRTQMRIVPSGMPDLPAPEAARPSPQEKAAGVAAAREAVQRWLTDGGAMTPLRIALPPGPGATLLYAQLALQWRAIGVPLVRVGWDEDADLRLIDEVAPADNAAWYLRHFACEANPVCDAEADAALIAARRAPSLEERQRQLAIADARLAGIIPFVSIARPLRWSLAPRLLRGFATNVRGVHPLAPLVAPQ